MGGLRIYPAIDLKGGKCVRLRQGRSEDATVYGEDPVAQAKAWEAQGAEWLHVVDLDGAFRGHPAHAAVLGEIVRAVGIPVQTGGGLRTDGDLAAVAETGVSRLILGTRALAADAGVLAELVEKYGERLAVGVDARDGFVQVRGWTETTGIRAADLAARAARTGVKTVIYTDTATDGMLRGPNFAGVAAVCDCVGEGCRVIASGGIHAAEDIRRLRALGKANLEGAIVGKALYDGLVTLAELKAAAEG